MQVNFIQLGLGVFEIYCKTKLGCFFSEHSV